MQLGPMAFQQQHDKVRVDGTLVDLVENHVRHV